jgi:hypothetical protein
MPPPIAEEAEASTKAYRNFDGPQKFFKINSYS